MAERCLYIRHEPYYNLPKLHSSIEIVCNRWSIIHNLTTTKEDKFP